MTRYLMTVAIDAPNASLARKRVEFALAPAGGEFVGPVRTSPTQPTQNTANVLGAFAPDPNQPEDP